MEDNKVNQKGNYRKIILLLGVAIVLLVIFILSIVFDEENYVGKIDVQYMKPNWSESWHTFSTDTAFAVGEEFFLNFDLAVSATTVKESEVNASITFLPPLTITNPTFNNSIVKTQGPEGIWRPNNNGGYSYVFKVPVSRSTVDNTSGKPVYTNPQHLQFKILPEKYGSQKISIQFDKPVNGSFNRDIIIRIDDADKSSLPSAYESNVSQFNSDTNSLSLISPNKDTIQFGERDNLPVFEIMLSPDVVLFNDNLNKEDLVCEIIFRTPNVFTGEMEISNETKTRIYFDKNSGYLYISEPDVIEDIISSFREGTRIDINILGEKERHINAWVFSPIVNFIASSFTSKKTIYSLSFDYDPSAFEINVLNLRNLLSYRNIVI